ncbi:MAG: hypothetical protein ABEK17_00335 [Candidatus Aenigmatarchaeota archaeon]
MEAIDRSIISTAIIWGLIIFSSAIILKDSGYFSEIITILGVGVVMTIIILGGLKSKMDR